ncbi:hypothetical protein LWI28_011567 [Acer negundo]|uniref:Uncharacterized protein n=1 Tax=Acer negundo TaxID=4023 RepID=A0AAD5I6K4_ACENE|nr:hypothetical protein LWI28_011567 [Acer negundo]
MVYQADFLKFAKWKLLIEQAKAEICFYFLYSTGSLMGNCVHKVLCKAEECIRVRGESEDPPLIKPCHHRNDDNNEDDNNNDDNNNNSDNESSIYWKFQALEIDSKREESTSYSSSGL